MDVRGFEPYQQTLKVGVKSKQETINVKHMNTIWNTLKHLDGPGVYGMGSSWESVYLDERW